MSVNLFCEKVFVSNFKTFELMTIFIKKLKNEMWAIVKLLAKLTF